MQIIKLGPEVFLPSTMHSFWQRLSNILLYALMWLLAHIINLPRALPIYEPVGGWGYSLNAHSSFLSLLATFPFQFYADIIN